MRVERIAYVVNVFPKISETFIASELAELRQREVEVRIVSLRRPSDGLRHGIVEEAGLAERTSYEPEEFASAVEEFEPQIVHAHFATEPTAYARELAGRLNIPFTFTAHGYDICRRPPTDFADRAAAASAVVTVSEANARYIAEQFGPCRVHVIPCGVDTERFRPADLASPAAARAREMPLVVCVARLVPVKNLGLLLEVCAELRARDVRFRCVIVGEGKSREELEAVHRRLALRDVVEFVGAAEQSDVLGFWQRASIGVLTSQQEGMPVSLMEAGACGVPVVAPAAGGIPELVSDGVTGLLAPPGDRQRLARAMQRLLEEPGLARRMGTAARERVVKQFSVRRQVDRLMDLWAGVLREEVSICRSM